MKVIERDEKGDGEIDFLRSFPLLADLSRVELEGLSRVMKELDLAPGAVLLTQNSPADAVYFLKTGAVKILVNGEMVAQIDKPQCFGEMSCLMPDTPASATVETAVKSRLVRISKDDFLDCTSHITKLWKTLFLQMSGRMVAVNGRLSEILHHLPQGLVKVSPAGVISNDYSIQCTKFFQKQNIAGLSFPKLAFPGDEKKQGTWLENFSLLFSESNMSFESCASLLPNEFVLESSADGIRTTSHFAISYSSCVNGAGRVTAVDIGIEDVTKQKELEAKHLLIKAKQEILAKITQAPDSFVNFLALAEEAYADSADFLTELKAGGAERVCSRVEPLMRRLHSLKGISGVFSFQALKATVHEAESIVSQLKGAVVNAELLVASLEKTLALFSEEKIKARGVFDEIPLDLRRRLTGVVFSQAEFESAKTWVESGELARLRNLLESVEQVDSKKLVASWPQEAKKIAEALGKSVLFSVGGEGGRISKDVFGKLDQVLIHLLRNGLDHGLEASDERLAKGKAPQGRITASIDVTETELLLVIEDDGRGLDGAALAKRARANPKLDQAAVESYVARSEHWRILLMPGFSTAKVVTDLSGRGVGLDAVANAIAKMGGRLTIESSLGEGACVFVTIPLC